MKKLILAATLVGIVGCAGSPDKADGAPVEDRGPVQLTFDWPVGATAVYNKFGTTSRNKQRTSVDMTYTVATQPTQEGWSLTYEDVRDVDIQGLNDEQRQLVEPLLKTIPSVEFQGGELVDIVGYEEMLAGLHEMMRPMYEQNPAVEAQMKASMTKEAFLSSARSEWAWRTTAWDGRTLEVGKPVESQAELTLGIIPGTATAVETLSLEGFEPCPKLTERTCVRLKRRIEVDSAELTKAMKTAIGEAVKIDEVQRYVEVELVAEPSTLLTYDMHKVEVTRLKTDGANSLEQRRVSRETYEWDATKLP